MQKQSEQMYRQIREVESRRCAAGMEHTQGCQIETNRVIHSALQQHRSQMPKHSAQMCHRIQTVESRRCAPRVANTQGCHIEAC